MKIACHRTTALRLRRPILQIEKPEKGLVMAGLAASLVGNALAQEDMRRFKLTPR